MSYITAEQIKNTYTELRTVTTEYTTAANIEIVLKAELERSKASALTDGSIEAITGSRSNAETREAAARQIFAERYAELEEHQQLLQNIRLALDLARINVEEIRMLMRLSELEARIISETD